MAIEEQVMSVGSSGGGFSTAAVPKGYLKCDIIVQAKGDKVQVSVAHSNPVLLNLNLIFLVIMSRYIKRRSIETTILTSM